MALTVLEQHWRDRHSCESADCWGFRAYPQDWFRRMLEAAIKAVDADRPVFHDLGAGIGTKCLFAKRMGCIAAGIEHNPHYVEEADRIGAPVLLGDVRERLADNAGYADIIFVNCPFRDPPQQIAFEAEVAAAMKPGSVLMLGNRAGPAPTGWKQLTSIVERDGAWLKPA